MPVLRCDRCGYTFAYLGKQLALPCPNRCRGYRSNPVHVDRNHVVRNGEGLDGHHSGAGRRERAKKAAAWHGM